MNGQSAWGRRLSRHDSCTYLRVSAVAQVVWGSYGDFASVNFTLSISEYFLYPCALSYTRYGGDYPRMRCPDVFCARACVASVRGELVSWQSVCDCCSAGVRRPRGGAGPSPSKILKFSQTQIPSTHLAFLHLNRCVHRPSHCPASPAMPSHTSRIRRPARFARIGACLGSPARARPAQRYEPSVIINT
jgi:hypothetical protein